MAAMIRLAVRRSATTPAAQPQEIQPSMSLLSRLVDPQEGEDRIPVHSFMAAVAEFKRGAPGVNAASIAASFNLSAGETTALTTWYTTFVATDLVSRELVHDVLMLGADGKYTVAQVQNRLGL
jgi:hypothetical protein